MCCTETSALCGGTGRACNCILPSGSLPHWPHLYLGP
ncbi:hypothetical protein E2C01_075974 [Portunus trituberculatus]|uniref:Uncharacterized protein n=1 Tax=Portunus trituberculatus TaxID=210409 RepID=A0A5B7IC16_PORTR|nr:hypothetical protein [Portunus trituberculatus]